MDNGQFAIQPNNRMRFFDPSLNPKELKTPDFEVALNNYSVSNTQNGDSEIQLLTLMMTALKKVQIKTTVPKKLCQLCPKY